MQRFRLIRVFKVKLKQYCCLKGSLCVQERTLEILMQVVLIYTSLVYEVASLLFIRVISKNKGIFGNNGYHYPLMVTITVGTSYNSFGEN